MNITQAQTLTIETLDAMTLDQLKEVADVLATSQAKKARLKLDQVKIVIEKRIKEAKKAKDAGAVAEFKAVENSIKRPVKAEQAELALDNDPDNEPEENEELDNLTIKQVEAMDAKTVKAFLKEHFGITTNERNVKNLRAILLQAVDPEDAEDAEEEQAEEQAPNEQDQANELLQSELEDMSLKQLKEFAKDNSIKHPKIIKADALLNTILIELGMKEEEQTPEPTKAPKEEQAPKQEKAGKASPDVQAIEKQLKEMQKALASLAKENAELKAEIFPSEVPMSDKYKLVATDFPELKDVQKALLESPYQVYLQVHEGLDNVATTFLVVYMNATKLILVDKSRQVDTTLDLYTKDMTATTVTIDKRSCPFKFYTKQAK